MKRITTLLVLSMLICAAAPSLAGSGYYWFVYDDQTLANALTHASAGHKIVMASGDYHNFVVDNKNFIRIEGQHSGAKPRIHGVSRINYSDDLTIKNLEFVDANMQMSNARHITFDSCDFLSNVSLDMLVLRDWTTDIYVKNSLFDGSGSGNGVLIDTYYSADLVLRSNTFQNLNNGVYVFSADKLYLHEDRENPGLTYHPANKVDITQPLVYFYTPNYPSYYPLSVETRGYLEPLGSRAYWVKVEGRCEYGYDYLDILALNGEDIERVTGDKRTEPQFIYLNSSNPVRLRFFSDYIISAEGYKVTTGGVGLDSRTALLNGDWLRSENGDYEMIMQDDGNLVIYDVSIPGQRTPVWDTCTWGQGGDRCLMSGNGNLVVQDWDTGATLWQSHTSNNPDAYLTLENNGRAYIYATDGRVLWHTN